MRSHRLHLVAVSFFFLGLLTSSVTAQSHWWYPERGSAITIELDKIKYDLPGGYETNRGFFNLVGFLGGRHALNDDMHLFWEIPFSNVDIKDESWRDYGYGYFWPYYEQDEFTIGNPLLGIEQIVGNGLFTRASIRFPLADDEKPIAEWTGISTAYDRFEAFVPKLFTVSANIGYREPDTSTPLEAQLMIGPTFMIPTEGDAELFVDFSAYLGVTVSEVQFGAVFGGRCLVSQSGVDFNDRFINSLGAIARLKLGPIEPGLHARYTFDAEMRELIDYTYGLNLAIPLGNANMTDQED